MTGRTLVLTLAGALLLALGLLVAVPLAAMWSFAPETPRPPLLRDLPTDLRADAAFQARIAETFPSGSSEAALIQRLRVEGFELRPFNSEEHHQSGQRWASFEQAHSFCRLTWRVHWQAEADRLTSASGSYYGTCL